jgi:hypothetical protein
MAEGVTDSDGVVRASDEQTARRPLPAAIGLGRHRSGGREVSPHTQKFRTATALLVGLAIGAVIVSVAVLSSGSKASHHGTSWSDWQPADGGLAGAQEIADFIAPYYRATPANQLAIVTAVNLNNASNPLQLVIPSSSSSNGLQVLSPSTTMAYNLCGIGSGDCSVKAGQPSYYRLLLLRREALELALYTFKYIGGVNTVVAILPPGHTVLGCTGVCTKLNRKPRVRALDIALAFDRTELQPWLNSPLRNTLPEVLPPTVAEMPRAREAELVSIITAHGLFSERTEQAQDGATVMVLSPLPPQ